ncbi:MAG: hypothetical protein A2W37_00690 [Chloroflexi bacterium RBG_16_63_12]|nr:MAG: hypothetical protein A2W37_00690 [Chloroflexi bacterium RBG_16_63_12]
MQALQFWKLVTMDKADFIVELTDLLRTEGIKYAVIGGQAVNAYAEPLISLDLDLAVAVEHLEKVEALLRARFKVQRFPHSLNISQVDSKLRVQVQTDPRYSEFVARAAPRNVLDLTLPVADVRDVLQGKIWAAQDSERRPSKRQKDLADIARLLEAYPELRAMVPDDILSRLV